MVGIIEKEEEDRRIKEEEKERERDMQRMLYALYEEYVIYDFSDLNTKELLDKKKKFENPGSAKKEIGWPEENKSLTDLFEESKIGLVRGRIIKERFTLVELELIKVKREIRDRGLTPKVFENARLGEVVDAIRNKRLVEGINISEKIKDPKIRFVSPTSPRLSYETFDMAHMIYKESRTITPQMQKMATDKLKENADAFAVRMYDVIKNLQAEQNISSVRDTIKALDQKLIPSYRGGKWHIRTLQDLQKRWKQLGLVLDSSKK